MKQPFKIGDRVRVYGYFRDETLKEVEGVIYDIRAKTGWITIQRGNDYFHAHPKQCRRLKHKKKRVKKTVERWMNLYPPTSQYLDGYYSSELFANNSARSERIACVKLTGSYYVEE